MSHDPRSKALTRRIGWAVKDTQHSLPVDGRHRYRRDDLPDLIDAGCEPREIAHLLRLSVGCIHRDIRNQGLRERLVTARQQRYLAEARARCERLIARHPDRSLHSLRHLEPRAIRYLERHDPAWLRAHRPQQYIRQQKRRHDATGPRGYEAALLGQVNRAIAAVRQATAGQRCTLRALRHRMGVSLYGFERIRRTGRCRQAIAGATGRPVRPSRG